MIARSNNLDASQAILATVGQATEGVYVLPRSGLRVGVSSASSRGLEHIVGVSYPSEERANRTRTEGVTSQAGHSSTSCRDRAPKTFDELIALMTSAGRECSSLRAVGGGFAFSNIHATEGYRVLLTEHLNRPLPLDATVLRDPQNKYLCSFEGGATIETLTKHLWAKGQALLNQPGYEKLTFIGTAHAGGHGSGIGLGPVSEAIRSIHLLTFDAHHRVVQKQVEPANGISHPERFRRKYPNIELVQDDTLFHACTVSMGSTGVIYSAVIEVQDAFYLREDRVLRSWTEFKDELPMMLADEDLHSFHVWFNPYRVRGEQDALVSLYRRSDKEGSSWAKHSCGLFSGIRLGGVRRGGRGIGIRIGGAQPLLNSILALYHRMPQSAPRIIKSALAATASRNVVLPSYDALNLGPPNRLRLFATEYGVELSKGLEAAESLCRMFQMHASTTGEYLLSPFALRFVRKASAFMSPMFDRDTCMIEMPLLEGLPNREELLQLFWNTLAPFGARPHWGQKNNIDASTVSSLFPRFSEFKSKVNELNEGRLFESEFTRKLGLDRA